MASTLTNDDGRRLLALERYEELHDVPEAALADLTRLAAQLADAPVAAIALLGRHRISLTSVYGVERVDLLRSALPCDETIEGEGIYELPDASLHPDYPNGIHLDGRPFYFFAGAPLVTPEGVPIGCLCVLDDDPRELSTTQVASLGIVARQVVTQLEYTRRVHQMDRAARMRQRVESALTVERNFVSAVLDTVGALVAVFDTAGRIVRFNRECEKVSGYEFSELVGGYVWEKLIPQDEVSEAITSFERLRAGGFPTTFENQWRTRDGSLRRIAWSATGLLDQQGAVAFLIATGIDVTVQRVSETTLRESEARYRQLVESSLGMVYTHDLGGRLLSINTYGAVTLGRTLDETVGHSLIELVPEDQQTVMEEYLQEIATQGEAQGLMHLCHISGEVRILAFRNKLIPPSGSSAAQPYVLGFGVDITEQVRAEEKLSSLMRQSNSILESVGDGIFGIGLDGCVTVVNPAAAQMLGYTQDEMLGRDMHSLIHHTHADGTAYPSADSAVLSTLQNLDTVRVADEVFWRKDGTSFPVEYVARPQIASDSRDGGTSQGRAVGVVVAFTDTTERHALDKMKDEFVSTVSHELRTPLTSMRAALGLVAGGALTDRPDKIRKMIEIAIGNTDRLTSLVNDILELERIGSGKAELHLENCSAGDLLTRAADLQQAAASRANLTILVEAGTVPIWADADRILQTLTNLLSNAIKFSNPGGTVTLRALSLDSQTAAIEVEDQGRGIPEDKLEQIFERFQQVDASDSRARGGTGLGLAICRSIVQQHNGRIWATSVFGQGSTFHMTLPSRQSTNLR